MKVEMMWAMYDNENHLHYWTVLKTRREVIARIKKNYRENWKHYYRRGYRIKKVAIIPWEEWERIEQALVFYAGHEDIDGPAKAILGAK